MMKNLDQVYSRLFRSRFLIPFCFVFVILLSAASIALIMRRSFDGLEQSTVFSVGADIFCIAVCAALCLSCLLSRNKGSSHTRTFVTLLTANALALFLDVASWVLQGKAAYRAVYLNVNVLFFMDGAIMYYLFWRYLIIALNMKTMTMRVADHSLRILLVPALLICMANYVYPVYFKVSATGNYQRAEYWYISQVYLGIVLLVSLAGMIFSKAPAKNKLTAASFIAVPLLNNVITRNAFGVTTQYAAVLVSLVLIYGVVFIFHERTSASADTEQRLAADIQSEMLPEAVPFLSERGDFELFASLIPAKETGGDFYDYFMTDSNHLAMVTADVSDKGVPAALFMMSSKNMIKSFVTAGYGPGQALEAVNDQICANNSHELFASVWLGVLDLGSGALTWANAGHQTPVLMNPNGSFKMIDKRHGFVVGGFPGMKYTENRLWMQPGSKLFLYTDGVLGAENRKGAKYGRERFSDVLNQNTDKTPSELVEAVREDVGKFNKGSWQSDDLAMLCIHYKGQGGKERI